MKKITGPSLRCYTLTEAARLLLDPTAVDARGTKRAIYTKAGGVEFELDEESDLRCLWRVGAEVEMSWRSFVLRNTPLLGIRRKEKKIEQDDSQTRVVVEHPRSGYGPFSPSLFPPRAHHSRGKRGSQRSEPGIPYVKVSHDSQHMGTMPYTALSLDGV